MQVFVENPNTIVIDVDQGRQGRGIQNISYTEVSGQYFLIVTYTDGTTETLGPLVVTGGAAFLLGGTTGAVPYQTAPNTTSFVSLGTANQVLVAGASAPEYTSNLTGLTVNNTPVGNTAPSTGAFTNLSASGTFALTGDQVQISEGGTGQTTANAAFNALAPSQTGNAGKYLKTDGTNTAWDQLDISTADITGTLPIVNGGTGATTASGARANLSAAVLGANNDITSMTGVTGGISSPDFVQFDTTATEANAVGKVYWDANQGTLDLGLLGGNVISRIGQSLVAYVTNAEATTITKGQAVYLFSAQGDRATVKLAYNTSDATSAKTFGVVAENIPAGGTGFVMCQGVLEGLNLAAFTAGDTLYLGATPGSLTATKPAAPNHLVYVGLVERANAGNGQLYVKVQNGYELDEIHDVQIITPQNGQTIIYDAATSLWKNANLTAGSGISVTNGAASITVSNTGVLSFSAGTTGLTPATSTTGAVTLGGTLNVANGGTGATTASGARTNLGLGTISTQNANNVTITGGTINNTSVGASTPSTGAFTSVAMTSGTVSTTPASANDIANKQYVDTLVSSGITYHAPVKYEVPNTTGNLNATYNNGTAGVGATLTNAGTLGAFTPDGVVAQAGDRILIYNQTNAAQNGVYVVTTVGDGSTPWVLTRASDANTYALKSPNSLGEGDAFFIQSGNTGAGETYVCNTQGTITFGTTAITFVQVSASQVYSAGTGLTLSGTQFSITNTAVTPNSYGSASAVGTFTVNQQGQLTLAATTPIAIANTQVSGLGTMSTQNANSVAITGGTINGTAIGGTTAAAGAFTTLSASGATTLSGLTASTALALDASKNIVSVTNTGTGNNVLATSPTLVTPNLGTPSAVTLTNATGLPLTTGVTGTLGTSNGGTGLTSFTANRVFYASSSSAIAQSANLTFDGTTLTVNNLTDSSLTSGRVTYATTGGNLTDSANLTFDGTSLTLGGNPTLSAGTANGVAYLNASKVLTTGSALTFDGTSLATTGSVLLNNAQYYYGKTTGGSNIRLLGINSANIVYVGPIDSGPGVMILNAASSSTNIQFYASGSEQMRLTSTALLVGTTTNTNSSRLVANGTISETVSSTQYLVASQFDIGTAPNKIPLNQYLGNLAYQNASSIAGQVGLSAGTAALPSLVAATDTDTGVWFPAANTLAFSTGGSERVRMVTDGLQMVKSIGLGNTAPSSSGVGITFPATQSASSDANTLDDYEEGTWTPAIRGSGTAGTYELASTTANYTKIGRSVTINANIQFAAAITGGGSGYLQITGAPFAKSGSQQAYGVVGTGGVDYTGTQLCLAFVDRTGSTSTMYIQEIVDNGSPIDLPISSVSANDSISLSITYFA